jgi:hypothetical protein
LLEPITDYGEGAKVMSSEFIAAYLGKILGNVGKIFAISSS